MRTLLQNSAEPKLVVRQPGLGFLDNVHRQGAGMLEIDDAVLATANVDPGEARAGRERGRPGRRADADRSTNNGRRAVTYNLSATSAALATGPNTFMPSFFNGSAPAVSLQRPDGHRAGRRHRPRVDVTITANRRALPDRSLYGGYIVLTPQGGGPLYRVPYAGFKGDYQSIQVLTPTANGFPWLAQAGRRQLRQPAGGGAHLHPGRGATSRFILLHFDHQSRGCCGGGLRRGRRASPGTGRSEFEYFARNSTATPASSRFAWDGMTTAGNQDSTRCPTASTSSSCRSYKALGDDANPAHLETWTSPVITIDRP